MQLTLSSKGQILPPAPMLRRPRAKLEAEERDGGIFLRPAKPATKIEPIEYPLPGTIKLTQQECARMDRLASEDTPPDFS